MKGGSCMRSRGSCMLRHRNGRPDPARCKTLTNVACVNRQRRSHTARNGLLLLLYMLLLLLLLLLLLYMLLLLLRSDVERLLRYNARRNGLWRDAWPRLLRHNARLHWRSHRVLL